MQAPDCIKLEPLQAEDVLAALGEECAMGGETGDLFRRLVTREEGIESFQWHPQKLAGRVQTTILRPDLTIEVWKERRKVEDFETTLALEPVRARLDELARLWGLQDAPLIEIAEPGARSRMSPLAERASHMPA